ncbi:MAG: DNA polymerase I [Candidatus Omnitrophota bacterium]
MSKKELYLIDATAFCYRAFYAIRGLATSFGQPTGAIYGFVNILNKILKEKKPAYLAACFDVSRDTFRSKKFAEYKIQRPAMPDELVSQIPLIKEAISGYGIKILEKPGFEADDIIATLAHAARAKGIHTVIVTSDKDMLQLVGKDIEVFSPYKDEGVIYDEKAVKERFGVLPGQIADLISLMGDSADNIPGVPGIGEKTASALIKEFGSLENLLANAAKISKEKAGKAITGHIEQIKLSRELAELDCKVALDLAPEDLGIGEPDQQALNRLFKRLEFKKFLKEIPPEQPGPVTESRIEDWDKAEAGEFIASGGEISLFGESAGGLVFYHGARFLRLDKEEPALKQILSSPKIGKVGHDLKRLKVALFREGLDMEGLSFDTMLAAYLLNPSRGSYGLEEVALNHLDEIPGQEKFSSQEALKLISELKPKLEAELKEKKLDKLFYDVEMPLTRVLAEMESGGLKLDLKLLKSLSGELEGRLAKLVKEVFKISGTEFNLNSPKQLRVILFEQLKLPVVKRTKTGPSTDEDVLNKLARKHKLPQLLLEYRQLTKLKTTYIDVLPELVDRSTGRIHTSFNQAATETGRLSSSNPNLQNIPVKTDIGARIRKAIIATQKDGCLVSCDYSQIELRILAHLSRDSGLIAAFKQGSDIHRVTSGLIHGVQESEVTGEMRERAKRVNFGIVYGLTSYGLSRDLDIALEDAQSFIDAYFSRYPGVKEYIDSQIEAARKDGFVTTILGRRRYIPEISSKNQTVRQFAERQAVNTPIQGSASDLIKLAMIAIDKELKKKELRAKMVLQIHDELLFDLPGDELGGLVDLAREKMENVWELDIPIRVDVKKGRNWLEMEEVK